MRSPLLHVKQKRLERVDNLTEPSREKGKAKQQQRHMSTPQRALKPI